jgi:sulfate adenylyltransferase subunit 1
VVAVNKMDLVDYSEKVFNDIVAQFKEFASRLDNIVDMTCIPISALNGDNVVDASQNMPWYEGSTLLYHLETVYIGSDHNHVEARFPVQWVTRPHSDKYHDFRGYAGRVAGGVFKPGDEIIVQPSGFSSRIKSIESMDGPLDEVYAPLSTTITLEDEIDISRGDMIVKANNPPHKSQEIEAMICWFSDSKKPLGKQQIHPPPHHQGSEGRGEGSALQSEHQHPPQNRGRPRVPAQRYRPHPVAHLRPLALRQLQKKTGSPAASSSSTSKAMKPWQRE